MSMLRISGLASGFDTDQMVKDLMKVENMRLDTIKKNKQIATWQQELYRDIIGKMRSFQSGYFDLLRPQQNITSLSSFSQFSYSVTSGGTESQAVKVSASAAATQREVSLSDIRLATKETWTGGAAGLRGIQTGEITSLEYLKTGLDGKDLSFTLAVGADTRLITVSQTELDGIISAAGGNSAAELNGLKDMLDGKITEGFGADFAGIVEVDGGKLRFDMAGQELKILQAGTNTESLIALGLTNGVSSQDYLKKGVGELLELDQATLDGVVVNGKSLGISAGDTIQQFMDKINRAEAGVEIRYEALSDRFVMTSAREGSLGAIGIEGTAENNAFFGGLFGAGNVAGIGKEAGQNARVTIDGVEVVQTSNTFTLSGITYTLQEESVGPVDVKISTNVAGVADNIKGFVEKYNEILEMVDTEIRTRKNRDYEPLTEEQREALSEKEIEKWEAEAKKGLLYGDSELGTMLSRMRNALIESVEGAGLTLRDLGIGTTSYQDRGKLTVDETKLNQAIETRFDDVVKLFTQTGVDESGNTDYKARGLGHRLNDILKDYVRTTRDANGRKGMLLEKAGVEGDVSNIQNALTRSIRQYDDRILNMIDILTRKEETYYANFARMEQALGQLQAQASSLYSQLGLGQ